MTTLRKGYETYVREYKKAEAAQKKKGFTMQETMYSPIEFETMYTATRESLIERVAEGKRKQIGNVYQEMVRRQRYVRSIAQAKELKKAYKEQTGDDVSYTKFLNDTTEYLGMVNLIDGLYQQFKDSGMSTVAARNEISSLIFGSN